MFTNSNLLNLLNLFIYLIYSMINIVLLIIVLLILMISVFKYERFQELIPLEDLISYEEVVCEGNPGEKGPQGNPGKVL